MNNSNIRQLAAVVPLIFLNINGPYFQWDLGSYCSFLKKKKKSKDSCIMHLYTLKIKKSEVSKNDSFFVSKVNRWASLVAQW